MVVLTGLYILEICVSENLFYEGMILPFLSFTASLTQGSELCVCVN